MPLVFLPDPECCLFSWGTDLEREHPTLLGLDTLPLDTPVALVASDGPALVAGRRLALLAAVSRLSTLSARDIDALPGSIAAWSLASKLALELVARERIVPTLVSAASGLEARWAVSLAATEDAAAVSALALSMPPSAHAVSIVSSARARQSGELVWAPEALLRAFLDAVADALVRASRGGPTLERAPRDRVARSKRVAEARAPSDGWDARWQEALTSADRRFEPRGFAERTVTSDLARWTEPALGARDRLRACFRLELPADQGEHVAEARTSQQFTLRFLLQSPDDPSLLVPAHEVWAAKGRSLQKLGRAFREPQESLLEALGRASRLFPPIEAALGEARPELLELDPATAWAFLAEGAAALSDAGFGVIVPAELTASGARRLRLRMRVGGTKTGAAGMVAGASGLALDALVDVDWQAVLGDEVLSAAKLAALAAQKAPLVRYRGQWIAVDPAELAEVRARVAQGSTRVGMHEALRSALAGETREGSLVVEVTAVGALGRTIAALREGTAASVPVPSALRATLRPYQQRGLAWLAAMGSLGLGACLADDMGLGKTVQLLSFLLHRRERGQSAEAPALLVAPTSVVGNWEREIERFAPSLQVVSHYGTERARTARALGRARGAVVLTTYGLLRRDAELLCQLDWSAVVLDEAQNIKNATSSAARAARSLRATHRFALTGTPVENRLAELWSILEFANPGLLGSLESFRRAFAVPIERHGDQVTATRLRRIVGPFILRRLKSDPAIVPDLPAKNEMKVVCTLTREQASLYKAVVDEELRRIEESDGIERRGRVLALLTFLKQICNHPAQYLGESGPLPKRSGKLARVTEMLEEAVAAGDKALVFTQFREMGEHLVRHLSTSLGTEVAFLHGGTSKKARDELVRRFQEDAQGPRVFVLSVKAGGTGLNLTAASHVFHYDRWWNPAVEDQATDRAYRIGQKRAVQVHKLVCAGTVEDKVDALLEHKRKLAARVVDAGESWITELGDADLRELFALSSGASVDGDDGEDPPSIPRPTRRRARSAEVSS
jgi:superfamily II DNA or RNA helicase